MVLGAQRDPKCTTVQPVKLMDNKISKVHEGPEIEIPLHHVRINHTINHHTNYIHTY